MIERRHRAVPPEEDERKAEESLRALLPAQPAPGTPALPAEYWSNLLVRSNRRIDEAASGKAISISWAWRVAIPGVAAIIAFLVAVRYYAPEPSAVEGDLAQAIAALPAETIDSLVAAQAAFLLEGAQPAASGGEFDLTREQIAEYLINSGASGTLLESLSEEEVGDVLRSLSVSHKSL